MDDSIAAETGLAGFRYRFQSQMPPDLQGHFWTRVSMACASSGLPCRRASLVRAGARGFSTRVACFTLGACVILGACVTLVGRTATVRTGLGSARVRAVSLRASTATGANSDGGPSRFGDSTAFERS